MYLLVSNVLIQAEKLFQFTTDSCSKEKPLHNFKIFSIKKNRQFAGCIFTKLPLIEKIVGAKQTSKRITIRYHRHHYHYRHRITIMIMIRIESWKLKKVLTPMTINCSRIIP